MTGFISLFAQSIHRAGHGAVAGRRWIDVEVHRARSTCVERSARVDGRREQHRVADRRVGLERAVHRAQRPPRCTSRARDLVLAARAQCLADAHRISSQTSSEAHVGVALVEDAPVQRKTSKPSSMRNSTNELPLRRSKMSGRLMRAKTSRTGTGCGGFGCGSARASCCGASRPLLGRGADRRVGLVRIDVGELERGDRRGTTRSSAVMRRAPGRPLRVAGPRLVPFSAGAAPISLAELLDLLQHLLELVLGAPERPRQAVEVLPARDPQVAQDEVHRARCRCASGRPCSRSHREQLAEAVAETTRSAAFATRLSASS